MRCFDFIIALVYDEISLAKSHFRRVINEHTIFSLQVPLTKREVVDIFQTSTWLLFYYNSHKYYFKLLVGVWLVH